MVVVVGLCLFWEPSNIPKTRCLAMPQSIDNHHPCNLFTGKIHCTHIIMTLFLLYVVHNHDSHDQSLQTPPERNNEPNVTITLPLASSDVTRRPHVTVTSHIAADVETFRCVFNESYVSGL